MSRLVTRINAIQYKTERLRIRREAKTEEFSCRNTNKKNRTICENRRRNRVEQNSRERTATLQAGRPKKLFCFCLHLSREY